MGGDVVGLGTSAGRRLAVSACPMCNHRGRLSVVERMVWVPDMSPTYSLAGVQAKRQAVQRRVPVLRCGACSDELTGIYVAGGVDFTAAVDDRRGG